VTLKDGLRHPLSEADSSVTSEADQSPTKARRGSRIAAIALALTLSAASITGLWLGFRERPVDRTAGQATGEPAELQPRVTAVVPVTIDHLGATP